MDDIERKQHLRQLRRVLRMMYLTSLGASHIYIGHAGRAREEGVRDQLKTFAIQQRHRRDEAAALLASLGYGLPWQRFIWHVVAWLWGRATALTGPSFSLHMLGNIEHESQRITNLADSLARELVNVPVSEALTRLARAETARKEWLVEHLRALVETRDGPG